MGYDPVFLRSEIGKDHDQRGLNIGMSAHPKSAERILIPANDLEQALFRVFAAIQRMIQYNEPLRAECEVQSKVIYCANGTE